MSLTTRFGLVAGTAAVALAGTAFGGAAADNDALAQIAELKNELAQLKAQNGEDWLTEQRAGEIRGIVQDVLTDAETRTSLQDSGAMAGWNNGFFLSSPDGNYKLKVGGLLQVGRHRLQRLHMARPGSVDAPGRRLPTGHVQQQLP